jgi:FkbM family methyltransferase
MTEATFNAGPRGPLMFNGFYGDPGMADTQHGSFYAARNRDRIFKAVERGGCFIDIGAHVGTTTLHAAQFFRRVIAIEPSQRNCDCLVENATQNHFDNVEVRRAAVSDEAGKGTLYLFGEGNAVGHSLTETVGGKEGTEDVEVITLDMMTETDCTMLHIDAEGHDVRILKGGGYFIRSQHKPPLIVMEFAPQMLFRSGSDIDELCQWLTAFSYRVCIDAGNNWAPMSHSVLRGMYDLWHNACAAWLDLYLIPRGLFTEIFP